MVRSRARLVALSALAAACGAAILWSPGRNAGAPRRPGPEAVARNDASAHAPPTEAAIPEGLGPAPTAGNPVPSDPDTVVPAVEPPAAEAVDAPGKPGAARPAAALDVESASGEAVPVAPGKAPPVAVKDLLSAGLSSVTGTVEISSERAPSVEEGVPVAIGGRVLEKESGAPVADASVILHSAFYLRRLFYDHELVEVARAVTGPDGEFLIDRLNVDPVHFGQGGLAYLSVRSENHAPLPAVAIEKVTPGFRNRLPDLVLTREFHTLRGRVLDQWEGKPVAGARVVATGEMLPVRFPKDRRPAIFLGAPEAITDEEGRFVLERVGPGAQVISVVGGDDVAGWTELTVPVEDEVEVRSRQIRGRIEGRVVDDRDRPIDVVLVMGGDNTTHTFADGSFTLENFRGDTVAIRFEHPDYRAETVAAVADGTRDLLVRMESRLPQVFFRVHDRDTLEPVEKVAIVLSFASGGGVLSASPFHISKEGLFAVRIPDGAVSASVRHAGRAGPAETVDLAAARDGDVLEVLLTARP